MQSQFPHVYWISGPPDSGKTTVATILADRHGLQQYHFDRYEMAHFGSLDPNRHPALYAAHPDQMTTEQRWLGSPPDEMASDTIASWSERFELSLDDLRSMPDTPAIIAEGPGMFPELVAPLIADPSRAIWLVPTEPFKLASVAQRGKPGNRHETSNPDLATHNLTQRDLLITAHIRRTAAEHDLRLIEIDGTEGVEAIAEIVEQHFGL